MGPDRSVSRAAAALFALGALFSAGLGQAAETQDTKISVLQAQLDATKNELDQTKTALAKTQSALEELARKVAASAARAHAPGAARGARGWLR
jgi:septal ring factor EnvC (AmiA/AmiB activator)